MSYRLWLAAFVILVLGVPTTHSLAEDSAGEPVLGRAQPIGLLLISTTMEESVEIDLADHVILGSPVPIAGNERLSSSGIVITEVGEGPIFFATHELEIPDEEDPQLGSPVLLASLISSNQDAQPATQVVHPDEIQGRLREAAQLLATSGLIEESRRIQSVITKIEAEHYERLLLKQKETELAVLQAEVNRLRLSVGHLNATPEVMVTVKVVDIHYEPETGKVALPQSLAESWTQIEEMIRDGKAKIISEPNLIVASKQTGRFQFGGEINDFNVSHAADSATKDFGITVSASPEILDGNRVLLQISADRKERNRANPSVIDTQRANTTLEVIPGRTYLFGAGLAWITNRHSDTTENVVSGTVFAVTVETVPSMLPVPHREARKLD